MSYTWVQGTGNSSTTAGTSLTATFISNVTAGDKIVVNAQSVNLSGFSALTATDNQGNTYSVDLSSTALISGIDYVNNTILSTVANSTGSLTVTLNSSVSSDLAFGIDEWDTAGLSVVPVATGVNHGSGGTLTSGSMTTGETTFVVAGFYVRSSGATYTAGTGYTLGYTSNSSILSSIITEYDASVSAGTFTPGCTSTGSGNWSAVSVAYGPGPTGSMALIVNPDIFAGASSTTDHAASAIAANRDTFSGHGAFAAHASAAISAHADTFAGAASFKTAASAAIDAHADTFDGTGGLSGTGSAAIGAHPDTFAGAGGFKDVGSAAIDGRRDTFAGSAKLTAGGTAAISAHPDTFSGSAGLTTHGSGAIAAHADTFSGSASTTAHGSAAIAAHADTFAGHGGSGIVGAAAIAAHADGFDGSGAFGGHGAGAIAAHADGFAGAGAASGGAVVGSAAIAGGADGFTAAASSMSTGSGIGRFGCCCTNCTCTICVSGCGMNQEGATVTLTPTGGGSSTSGTTGADGCVGLTLPAGAGSYTVKVSVEGFADNTSTHTINCGNSITIDLGNPPTGGQCCSTDITPAPTCNGAVIPDTLYVTDSCGTTALTFALGGFGQWRGCTQCSASPAATNQNVDGEATCTEGGGMVSVFYNLGCTPADSGSGCQSGAPVPYLFSLERSWYVCTVPDECPPIYCQNPFDEFCNPINSGTQEPCGAENGYDIFCFNATTCIPFTASGDMQTMGVENCEDGTPGLPSPLGASVAISA